MKIDTLSLSAGTMCLSFPHLPPDYSTESELLQKTFLINRGYPCRHKVLRCLWKTSLWIQSKRKIFRLHIQFKLEVRVQKCSLPLSCSIWNSNCQKNKGKMTHPHRWYSLVCSKTGRRVKERAFLMVFIELCYV